MNAWIFLLAAIACSVLVAHIVRLSKEKDASLDIVFFMNYVMAFGIAFFRSTSFHLEPFLVLIAIITGAIFILDFFLFAESVKLNGLGRSIVAMRVSLAIPVIGSVLLFNEKIHFWSFFGFICIAICLYLISSNSLSEKKLSNSKKNAWVYILILFVFSGLGDFSMKIAQSMGAPETDFDFFISLICATAGIISLILITLKRPVWKSRDVVLGLSLGIPNVGSSLFLVWALQHIDAVLVYPIVNSAVILFGSAVGFYVWKDKISTKQGAGLAFAILAIITLIID